ncbi:MAG: hypothetical protein LH606_08425 [Cytophagaceae bacterium]|nr:hypothetical protein [Cytophagaceae bacterium]
MKAPFDGYARALVRGLHVLGWLLLAHTFVLADDPRPGACSGPNEPSFLEKKRVITKVFSVSHRDRLFVSNQFGDVRINLWDKPEIRSEITILGLGVTEEEADRFSEAVSIEERREGELISLETHYANQGNTVGWWQGLRNGQRPKDRGVRISYVISLPRYTILEVRSRFSDTVIPEFSAPLKINSQYGNFTANRLMNVDNDIHVTYGQVNIKQLNEGNLKIYYSKLHLDKAARLRLQNNYGSLNLVEVADLDAIIQYSNGKIGTLTENGKLSINYSNHLRLPVLMRTAKTLDVRSNYTSLNLPVQEDSDLNFNVEISRASFGWPSNLPISFERRDDGVTSQGGTGVNRYYPKYTKTYKGKVGKGGCVVTIVSNYGTVKFVE